MGSIDEPPVGQMTLQIEQTDQIARIVLDRPEQLNTITPTMLDELAAAVDSLDADADVRCLLVTGAGDRAFSAGADLSVLADEMDAIAERAAATHDRLSDRSRASE